MTSPSERMKHLSVPEFARAVGVSPYTVRKWVKSLELHAININTGGRLPVYRIPEWEVEATIKRISTKTEPETGDSGGYGVSGGSPNDAHP